MVVPPSVEITELLGRWRAGDRVAEEKLMAVLYPVMRAIAQREILAAGHGKVTVRATELANEAYLRVLDQRTDWESRTHFLAIAGRMVRRVIVDLIRARETEKRGGSVDVIPLDAVDEQLHPVVEDGVDLLILEDALEKLAKRDVVAAQVVELRYFSGLNNDEVAKLLDVGVATVVRHWQFGRAFLFRKLA